MKIEELLEAAWQNKSGKNPSGGLNQKGVNSYRREHPGSKLKTAVTTKPSKLKKGSKASKRRKSFCARMKGMKKHRTGAKTAHDPNSRINKSLRKWHCESLEEMRDMIIIAEAYIAEKTKQRLDPKCWTGYHKAGTKMKGGVKVNNCVANENMDHEKDDQAVPELKAALTAQKKKLQSASNDETYDIIDKMMTRIAKSHGISGQKLHDMWVDKYKQIPDTWIMKEAANAAQQAAIAIAKKKDNGVDENFADGKGPGRAGDSARHGIPKHATKAELEKASHAKGRKGQLARWQMNMRNGKNK
jgi:hypothetical protein